MKQFVILLSIAVLLCGCNNKPAQEKPLPQNNPTVNGESINDTPSDSEVVAVKELIKKAHLAVCNDDAAIFAQCFVASDTMKSFIDTTFVGAKIQHQLEEAIVKRFGEEGWDLFCSPSDNPDRPDGVFLFSFNVPPKDEAWWDDPDVDIEIDMDDLVGEFYNPWQGITTPLRKQDGRWLYDFTQAFPPEALADVEKMQNTILKGMQHGLDLLKQENIKVIDLNVEMGKLIFGNDEDEQK